MWDSWHRLSETGGHQWEYRLFYLSKYNQPVCINAPRIEHVEKSWYSVQRE